MMLTIVKKNVKVGQRTSERTRTFSLAFAREENYSFYMLAWGIVEGQLTIFEWNPYKGNNYYRRSLWIKINYHSH